MSKKKRATKVSKGERPNVSQSLLGLISRELPQADKLLHKLKAWKKGKNPWMNFGGDTGKVRMNSVYGDPRKRMQPAGTSDND